MLAYQRSQKNNSVIPGHIVFISQIVLLLYHVYYDVLRVHYKTVLAAIINPSYCCLSCDNWISHHIVCVLCKCVVVRCKVLGYLRLLRCVPAYGIASLVANSLY